MRKRLLSLILAVLFINLALPASIKSQDDITVQNINFGELLLGGEVFKEDLQDCVVGVDFDGMTCAKCPCGGAVDTFIEWHQKYSAQGFILLSFYVKDEAKEKFAAFCKSKKVPFPVYFGGSISGLEITDLPAFVLFDHNGRMVFNGHPKNTGDKLAAAMKAVPDRLVGPGPYKKLKALAEKARQRKDLGPILKILKEKYLNSSDEEEKAEAEMLAERLTSHGNRLLRQAGNKKNKEPLECLNLYQQTAALYKGDEIGAQADQALKELQADKAFQDNLKADRELAEITAEVKKLKPCNKCAAFTRDCPDCHKRNASMEVLGPKAKGLVKKYPDSPAAAKVKELLPVE